MAKEPIPTKEYLFSLGETFLSAGKTFIYEIASGPHCKIYWQKHDDPDLTDGAKKRLTWIDDYHNEGKRLALTPWTTESAWYDSGDPNKGWIRKGANYPSYDVYLLDSNTGKRIKKISITVRWIPLRGNIEELITAISLARANHRENQVIPNVTGISEAALERMKSNVNLALFPVDESCKIA